MKNIRYKKKYLRNGISILILCLLTLSHTTRNSKRGGKRRKNADGDLKNGLPSSCPASPLLSPLGLEPPPSEPSPGVVGVLRSTLALPALMTLMTAAWALRLATRLNSASARRFLNSLPGSQRTLTSVMFWAVNLSASSAPLDERTMEKSPRSPRRIFLPSRSCSLMQSTVMSRMAGWRSLNAW